MFDTIPEKSKCPYERDIEVAVGAVRPILEILFEMPAPGPVPGSAQWVQALIDNPDLITFKNMMQFPSLLRGYVKSVGRVQLRKKETVPEGDYPAKGSPGYLHPRHVLAGTRRSMTWHPNWPVLRSGAVNWAIDKCKDFGITPVRIKRETLPERIRKQGYDNYEKTINTFHACYCYAQGYLRTSDMARAVLVYLHLGRGVYKQKPSKSIPILHKKLQTGLHRFTGYDKIEKHWASFIHLVTNNVEDLTVFLDDKGTGTVSRKYLIAVETGLRNFAQHERYAMGVHAFDNADSYHQIALWKKREAYIAVCRNLKGVAGYLKYIGYDWADYQMRAVLQKTFDERHACYTSGEKKLRGLPDPECWGEEKKTKQPSRRRRKQPAAVVEENDSPQNGDEDTYIYDSEEDEWVKIKD